jgi:GDPmannose 4,6-dehydratase
VPVGTGDSPAIFRRAIWFTLPHDQPDDLVVASGETYSVGWLRVVTFSRVCLNWKDPVVINDKFTRPGDVERLVGDLAKTKLGRQPAVALTGFADAGRCGSGQP